MTSYDSKSELDKYLYSYDNAGLKNGINRNRRDLEKVSGQYKYSYDAIGRLIQTIHDGMPYKTKTGKIINLNEETGIQILYDTDGNYYRIQDTNMTGSRSYLGIDASDVSNKTVNGRSMGRSKSEYQQVTHFANTDK